jgi:hypothetical protein
VYQLIRWCCIDRLNWQGFPASSMVQAFPGPQDVVGVRR